MNEISFDTYVLAFSAIVGPIVAVILSLIWQQRMAKNQQEFQNSLIKTLIEEREKFEAKLQEEHLLFDKQREKGRESFESQMEEERKQWKRADLTRQELIVGALNSIAKAINPDIFLKNREQNF